MKSIENIKKFRDHLDDYLKDAGKYLEIHEKFAKDDLSKIIKQTKGNYGFINYKLKSKGDDMSWNSFQKKQNFAIVEDKRVMNCNYVGCYEVYSAENVFKEGKHKISLEVLCEKTQSYHSIGLINETYSDTAHCVCCKNECFFMVQRNGDTFNGDAKGNLAGCTFDDRVEP